MVKGPTETIAVWSIGSLQPQLVEQMRALCTAAETARAARIVDVETRDRQMVTRGAVRRLVAARLGIDPASVVLTEGIHGKPEVADDGVSAGAVCFNVTHTSGLSLIAISSRLAVGIDAEPVSRSLEVDLANRICIAAERRRIGRLARRDTRAAQALLRTYWVRKEAVAKADGRGLQIDVARLGVTAPQRISGRRSKIARDIALADLEVGPDHVAAIAWAGAAEIEPVRELNPDG